MPAGYNSCSLSFKKAISGAFFRIRSSANKGAKVGTFYILMPLIVE